MPGCHGAHARLTVALTSWSESKWASAMSCDALMPKADAGTRAQSVIKELEKSGPSGFLHEMLSELGEANGLLQRSYFLQ